MSKPGEGIIVFNQTQQEWLARLEAGRTAGLAPRAVACLLVSPGTHVRFDLSNPLPDDVPLDVDLPAGAWALEIKDAKEPGTIFTVRVYIWRRRRGWDELDLDLGDEWADMPVDTLCGFLELSAAAENSLKGLGIREVGELMTAPLEEALLARRLRPKVYMELVHLRDALGGEGAAGAGRPAPICWLPPGLREGAEAVPPEDEDF
jgi:hypothetical protein